MGYFKNVLIAEQVEVADRFRRKNRRSTYRAPNISISRDVFDVMVAGYILLGIASVSLIVILAVVL